MMMAVPRAGSVLSVQLQVRRRWVRLPHSTSWIEDRQSALVQVMRGRAALAVGLWSGHATPSEAESSVSSIPDAVSNPPVPASGHTALDKPGRGGDHGRGDR